MPKMVLYAAAMMQAMAAAAAATADHQLHNPTTQSMATAVKTKYSNTILFSA